MSVSKKNTKNSRFGNRETLASLLYISCYPPSHFSLISQQLKHSCRLYYFLYVFVFITLIGNYEFFIPESLSNDVVNFTIFWTDWEIDVEGLTNTGHGLPDFSDRRA